MNTGGSTSRDLHEYEPSLQTAAGNNNAYVQRRAKRWKVAKGYKVIATSAYRRHVHLTRTGGGERRARPAHKAGSTRGRLPDRQLVAVRCGPARSSAGARAADQMRMEAATFAGVLGAIIGSFLNVVAYRLPRHESLITPASHCPGCGTPVKPYDNIPVLSWLLLRGHCRSLRRADLRRATRSSRR